MQLPLQERRLGPRTRIRLVPHPGGV